MRSFLLIVVQLCILVSSVSAAPLEKKSRDEVTDQAKALLGSFRSRVTSIGDTYRKVIEATGVAQADKINQLDREEDIQRKALELLETELASAVDELFTANAQILIIPSLVRFSEQLVTMTEFYREQSGFPAGSETLSCGAFCQYYQERRNALSRMIGVLRDDLYNLRTILVDRRQMLEQIAREIGTVAEFPNSQLVRFGFDHFINQRIALLESETAIVEDVFRLGANVNFAGQIERVPQPCSLGIYLFGSFLGDLKELSAQTRTWQAPGADDLQRYNVGRWSQGEANSRGPLRIIQDRYVGYYQEDGMYLPGWLDNWGGCSQTRGNVLRDFESKVEAEVQLGNLVTARKLDENSLELRVAVNALNAQLTRLNQFSRLFTQIDSIARTHAVTPKSEEAWSDIWKGSVISQVKNFERLAVAQREILVAAKDLLLLAENELAPLGTIKDVNERSAKLFPLQRRLEAIASQGFIRLELELSLAADSLGVMAANILSSEGSNNQGGLGEAISGYERSSSTRNQNMKFERDVELPQRLEAAQVNVFKLEQSRATTVSLLNEIETKQVILQGLINELDKVKSLMNRFFNVTESHPFYLDLARKFVAGLKLSRSSARALSRPLELYLKSFSTVGSLVSLSQGAPVTVLGKKAQKLRVQYRSRLAKMSDDVSAPQLGGASFTSIMKSLKEIRARGNAL